MLTPSICCESEEEFESRIRLSKDARLKAAGNAKKKDDAEHKVDRIAEAETKGRRAFFRADKNFFETARLDPKTVFYLEERFKSCYNLREDPNTLPALINCLKENEGSPIECECGVKNYLRSVQQEKHEFAENAVKNRRPPKKKKE